MRVQVVEKKAGAKPIEWRISTYLVGTDDDVIKVILPVLILGVEAVQHIVHELVGVLELAIRQQEGLLYDTTIAAAVRWYALQRESALGYLYLP